MSISLKCTGCKCTLRLRDDLSGRKVKCPRCKTVLLVPQAEEEDLVEVAAEKKLKAEKAAPPRKPTGRTGRVQREEPAASRQQKMRIGRDEEEEAAPPVSPSKKKKDKEAKASKYKPCPQCGAEGATRVKWTSWGSFYGPALFTHVSCPECAYCYNGKTGRSNGVAIAMFVTVPLIGILAILGGIFYVLVSRGHLTF